MGDIFHHAMHGAREKLFVLVVHGHDDEKFGTTWGIIVNLSKGKSLVLEVVWIASGGGVAHVGEFAIGTMGR
jgi:hypothetical protein